MIQLSTMEEKDFENQNEDFFTQLIKLSAELFGG
jgi:hypothetical protein